MSSGDLTGATLAGRYELQHELGRGGMAIVYRALDVKVQRHVAVKVMREDVASVIGSARFHREIEVLAKLNHPNIVGLLDRGEDADRMFYVMPLVDGSSLRDRLNAEGSLSIDEALDIADDVCRGLAYAHAMGYVHRDIKPENILLTMGSAMLTDFGIVRMLEDVDITQLTATGVVIGTVLYMSPEQSTGLDRVDARTDIYSLATVLYEMLAGEPPFVGNTAQSVMARKSTESPRPLRTVREAISPALEAAVLHGLERHPADRYRTAGDFQQALRQATRTTAGHADATSAAASSGQVVTPVTPPPTASRGAPVWRRWAVAAAAVLALGVVGTLVLRPGASAETGVRLAALPCSEPEDTSIEARLANGTIQSVLSGLQRVHGVVPLSYSAGGELRAAGLTPGRVADTLNARVIQCSVLHPANGNELLLELVEPDEAVRWRAQYALGTGSPSQMVLDLLSAIGFEPDSASVGALEAARPRSATADSLYKLGIRFYQIIQDASALTRAVDLFEQALTEDSSFALAHAALAVTHAVLSRNHGASFDPVEQRALARRHARAALRLQPGLAESHAAVGAVAFFDWEFETAEREFETAVSLSPNDPQVLDGAGFYWATVGDSTAGIALQKRVLKVDPYDRLYLTNVGWMRFVYGNLEGAIRTYAQVYELHPEFLLLRNVYALALLADGQIDAARAIYEADSGWADLYGRSGSSDAPGGGRDSVESQYIRGVYYAYAGKPDTVRLLIGALTERYRRHSFSALAHHIAELYALIDQRDSSFTYLEDAVDQQAPYVLRLARDPQFANLHGDPRFDELVRRIGVPQRRRSRS